ncbi:YhcN/YlaJ family sporulation lipoprotein [Oceanobacillus salinisoli]|uniref:YhcN/YlaJ family sporulation lipoprotein n=1 Tax=Oceanobacillus salinisoli TaxID=2678611 RepID=UPI001E4FF346|nr:YhcN/YlaJ family sporulation lipoprotein [Oceanobacillus salinisoli]
MKKKLVSGAIVVTLALAGGCQAADQGAAPNGTMDQPRYDTNTGDGMTNVRNYTMQRDADNFQNRDTRNINNRTMDPNTRTDNVNRANDNRTNNNFYNRMNNNNNNNINRVTDNRNENRYEVSSEAADRISDRVEEIDNVYVLTTENNAYVAAELDTDRGDQNNRNNNRNNQNRFDDELSEDVKDEIADIVQSVDNNIDNVYISTNPDFFDLTNNYVNDVNRGEPIEGFFDQFNNMVERLSPQNQTR